MHYIVAIGTYTVQPYHIALVFYSTCIEQCLPGMITALRPVGYIKEYIIFALIPLPLSTSGERGLAGPNGETKVVANLQIDLPAFHRCNKAFVAGGIMFIFSRISKQMPLIVITITAIWQHPDKA